MRIYNELNEFILKIDNNIQRNTTSVYVSYLIDKSFVEVRFQMNNLFITLMPGEYNDPNQIISKISDGYRWVNNNKINITPNDDLEYIKDIIKQSFYKSVNK